MKYEIEPTQLIIYLQMAMKCAEHWNCKLPKAEELCKKLMQVNWDENAQLVITEK